MAEETERVVMNWPKELKTQVREATGGERGGLTDFVLKAVNLHLENDADVEGLENQLGEARHFTQQLADQLVLGGSPDERLQFLMELEFPDWIQTQGWPSAYAERVRPHAEARADLKTRGREHTPDCSLDTGHDGMCVAIPDEGGIKEDGGPQIVEVAEVVPAKRSAAIDEYPSGGFVHDAPDLTRDPIDVGVEIEKEAVEPVAAEPTPDAAPDLPHDMQGDDLFARLKAAGKLKIASDIPKPDPVEQKDLCPTCNEEKIDGECWTCEL